MYHFGKYVTGNLKVQVLWWWENWGKSCKKERWAY